MELTPTNTNMKHTWAALLALLFCLCHAGASATKVHHTYPVLLHTLDLQLLTSPPTQDKSCRHTTWQDLVTTYNMQPLSGKGGLFIQTYIANRTIPVSMLPLQFSQDVPTCPYLTTIYFLLHCPPFSNKSHLHLLQMDKVWHFYLGTVPTFGFGEDGLQTLCSYLCSSHITALC